MADDNLMTRISRAASRIDPALTERDVERLLRRAAHKRTRLALQHRVLMVGGAAACAAGILVAALGMRHGDRRPAEAVQTARQADRAPTPVPLAPAPTPTPHLATSVAPASATPVPGPTTSAPPLRLADGSTATPLGVDTTFKLREDSPERVSIDLSRGRGRFEVVPNRQRGFEVHAGDVSVHVVGTAFTMERVADRVGVSVDHGTVRVDWGLGTRQLSAGESGWFPPLQVQAAADGPRPPARTADELLRAADRERLAGRAEEGARLLRRVLHDHRGDPRAPLAAMTLGRLLMIELARPQQAAAAFADARALAPRGPFAEDALAREVEAWSKSGDAVTAAKRARFYLDRFPNGHRADTVKAFGGLE